MYRKLHSEFFSKGIHNGADDATRHCSIADDGLTIVRERCAEDTQSSVTSSANVDDADDATRFHFLKILLNFQNLYIALIFTSFFTHFTLKFTLHFSRFQAKWIPEIIRIVRCSVVHDGRVQNPTNTGHSTPMPSTLDALFISTK